MSTTLRWVKASERLPEKNGDIIFRFIGITNQVGCSYKYPFFYRTYGEAYGIQDHHTIEWLEEQKNDEPEASNLDLDSVASHSSGSGNSIGQFKVLMYGNMLVNSFNLTSGIYEAACPALYKSDDTIEERIKASKSLAEAGIMPIAFSDAYCENISKCKFVDVSLSQINKQP